MYYFPKLKKYVNIYNSQGQLALSLPDVPFLTTRTFVTFLVETLE